LGELIYPRFGLKKTRFWILALLKGFFTLGGLPYNKITPGGEIESQL